MVRAAFLRNDFIYDLCDLFNLVGMLMLPDKKEKEFVAWGTESEIEYINNIGTYRPDNCDRITFLQGYIASLPILKEWEVTDPCIQHAIKKLLCAGQRGVKDEEQDVQEAIDTLERYKEMKAEDELA